jgi:hypothetical protein
MGAQRDHVAFGLQVQDRHVEAGAQMRTGSGVLCVPREPSALKPDAFAPRLCTR